MRRPDKFSRICLTISAIVFTLSFDSCKKDDPAVGFSKEIENLVPQAIIDDLRKNGMQIYEGKLPPKIEGSYTLSPMVVTKRFGENDNYEIGTTIDSYKYRFYNLTNNNQQVSIDSKNISSGTENGKGQGAYISGNGNFFTVFAEVQSEYKTGGLTIKSKQIETFSGELTENGIKNLQTSVTLKSKEGDTAGYLIEVGASRMFKDGDGFSEKTSNFRLSVPAPAKTNETNCTACAKPTLQANK